MSNRFFTLSIDQIIVQLFSIWWMLSVCAELCRLNFSTVREINIKKRMIFKDASLAQSMSLPALGSENEEENGWNADFEDSFAHPLERTLFEIEDDFGIDAAIQRVTICNIIYGNFNNSRALWQRRTRQKLSFFNRQFET